MKHNFDENGKCHYCDKNAIDIITDFYTSLPEVRNELIKLYKDCPKYYDMVLAGIKDVIYNKMPCLTDDEFTVKDIIK